MITLTVTEGSAYVWNADDWLKLREQHRIVGQLVGCLPNIPRQESFLGLPLELMQEEATLLVEEKIATFARYPSLSRAPGSGIKTEYEKYRKRIYEEQVECLMESRRQQVASMIDTIAEGKRQKLLGLKKDKKRKTESTETGKISVQDEIVIDKEELLQEEYSKIKPVTVENTQVQIFTVYPWLRQEDACPVRWDYPKTTKEKLLYQTFKDMWKRGYYITSGKKFGGDFLVYPGDPLKFHAHYLVLCKERSCAIPVYEYVALGRLGTNVRKTVIIASFSDQENKIIYQSVKWREPNR